MTLWGKKAEEQRKGSQGLEYGLGQCVSLDSFESDWELLLFS